MVPTHMAQLNLVATHMAQLAIWPHTRNDVKTRWYDEACFVKLYVNIYKYKGVMFYHMCLNCILFSWST